MQPFRIPAEVGQFSHDSGGRALVKLAFGFVQSGGGGRSDASDVLQKHEPRTAIGCDSADFEEQAGPLPVKPGALPGNRQVLARESGNDAIHFSTPSASVEGAKVGPDRSRIQASFFHARRKDCGCVGFPLNVTNGASLDAQVSEPGSQSFSKHSDSAAKLDGMYSHVILSNPPQTEPSPPPT
jgi:hypothetical protein